MNDFNLNEEKNDLLGELDHLNSFIGFAKSLVKDRKIEKLLTSIQNDIFPIQANIAKPPNVLCLPDNISQNRILDIQKQTFLIEKGLKKINHFILPEGTTAACLIHCVRTIIRQVERKIPGYLKNPTNLSMYFDRVACLMFALSRQINQKNGFAEQSPKYQQSSSDLKKPPTTKRRNP